MGKETKAVTIHVSMSAYQRDLIDFHARMLHVSRSQYIVQTAAFGKRSFSLNLDAMPDEVKRKYNVYHTDNPAVGYMPTPDGNKPRKAEDGRIRDQRISLRVSPYERETLIRHAASMGLSLTDYLVYCGLYQSDVRKGSRSRFMAAREELRAIFVELRAQGRNLNQIAAAANRIASLMEREALTMDVDAGLIDRLAGRLLAEDAGMRGEISKAIERVCEISDEADVKRGG